MPKYEYACKSCGEHLEVVQTFADAALTECPSCDGALRKVFSAPSIAFKGSGFYRTDNRKRRTEPSPEKADAKVDATSDSKTDAKSTDSKTETKSEPAKAESKPSSSESKPKAAEAKSA
ncbi:MAG: FmdB family transcriptional regulator [Actinomycetota bacterium]|nr:FmdB family transcriptional regulator [Actinomycetota bacterium]